MSFSSYIYRKSFYHRLDPRAKLIFTLLITLAILMESSVLKAFCYAFLAILLSISAVGVKESFLNFRRISLLVLFIIIFSPLQQRSGKALVSIGSFMLLSMDGALSSSLILFKFITISYIFSLLLETERLENIIAALRYFRLPYSVSLTVSMTLSFIPTLANRYAEIRDAISLRIGDQKRKESLLAVLTSLIVSAIKLIPETASVLEERGFSGKCETCYRSLEMNGLIFTEMVLSVIIPLSLIFG